MPKFDLHAFARAGAAARINEIHAEIASIAKIFPHLEFGSAVSPGMPDRADAKSPTRTKKKPTWTAAARKAVSARMKRYWAQRRKAKAK
jgi:hypothetical protein